MATQQHEIQHLLLEIDKFVSKYYLNQTIKGLILFIALLFFSYLFFTSLAYFFDLSSWIRLTLFIGFILMNLYTVFRWVIFPMLRKFGVIARIDHLAAARLIGELFPDVADRLINTLQLIGQSNEASETIDLLAASIAQKTKQLSLFNFSSAIDL